jgi:class 3 adenylate cyclase
MGLFSTRTDRLERQLKVRTRQLETMNRFSTLRDQCQNSKDFLEKAAAFIGTELASRFVAIVLMEGDQLRISANTMPEIAKPNGEVIRSLAQGVMMSGKAVTINNTRAHPQLRLAKVACALAAPLLFKSQYIGAVVVFRFKRLPFKQRSLHTIHTLCAQLPSSLDYVAAGENVSQRNKELKIIYEIDRIKEKYGKDAQMLLEAVAEQIQKSTSAKSAFIFLSDRKSKTPKFASVGNANAHKDRLKEFADEAVAQGEMVEQNLNSHLKQGVCVPVAIGDDHAAFGMANSSNEAGFTEEDKRILAAIAHQADSALFEDREKRKMKETFSRYVSADVLDILLKNPESATRSERHEVSMLFADMRGFTSLSEKIAPENVVALLNEYFEVMTDIILKNKGTLDKFVGDEIVAMFGAPVFFEDHAKRSVKAAIEMQKAFKTLQAKWKGQGLPALGLGVGIDSGNVVVGSIGGERRMDYTAIGDHVNTAARLCSQATDGQVLMTQNTYDQITKSVIAKELTPVALKGKSSPVRIYNAISVR